LGQTSDLVEVAGEETAVVERIDQVLGDRMLVGFKDGPRVG
jgi:hypothetical protein